MASFFQSVTTRTAGFYTMDQSLLSTPTVIISLLWMFIGGSPMGTAGGVKTTTIAILILSIAAYLQGKKDVEYTAAGSVRAISVLPWLLQEPVC